MRHRRRGTILVVTMMIVFTLAALVLVVARSSRVEVIASANAAAALQASAIERGAEQYLLGVIATEQDAVWELGEEMFAAVQVGDGYFWVLRPDYGDESLPAFGLTDEAGKLNINTADYDTLMRFPEMTDEAARSIIDWRDADSTLSSNGAENEYYLSLNPSYNAKNRPFETVEELFLVRGITREMMYGQSQQQLGDNSNIQRSDGQLFNNLQSVNGLFDMLTCFYKQPTTSAGGQIINVNDRTDSTRQQLRSLLQTTLGGDRGNQVFGALGRGEFANVFAFYYQVGLKPDEFDLIADSITAVPVQNNGGGGGGGGATATPVVPKININTAPRQVLFALPNLDTGDVEKLVSQRRTSATTNSISWIVQALEREKVMAIADRVTSRTAIYSADILAVAGNGRAYKRFRIVIDASATTPRIVYRRDITDRGWPMDPQILASLRAGQGPGQWAGMNSMMGGSFR